MLKINTEIDKRITAMDQRIYEIRIYTIKHGKLPDGYNTADLFNLKQSHENLTAQMFGALDFPNASDPIWARCFAYWGLPYLAKYYAEKAVNHFTTAGIAELEADALDQSAIHLERRRSWSSHFVSNRDIQANRQQAARIRETLADNFEI